MENNHHQVRVYPSFGRLWTIAKNTITEIVRQMFFYVLVIFAVVVLFSSVYFSQFSAIEIDKAKFIKDFCLAGMKIFGVIIAVLGTAQLLPLELENRTIYPILAKPVYRGEFLYGKYLGLITLLFLTMVFMSLVFAVTLFYTEHQLASAALVANVGKEINPEEVIRQIHNQTRDPGILKAIVLIYFQMVVISSISLLIATFATSVIFTVISSVIVYFCAHLESLARQSWLGDPSPWAKLGLLVITFFIPDLAALDVVDNVVTGQFVSMSYVLKTVGYAAFYSAVVLIVAHVIFQEKEI